MEPEKKKKSKILPLIIIIIILIILAIGGYFVWFNDTNSNNDNSKNTNLDETNQIQDNENVNKNDSIVDNINIEQGNLLNWPNERVSFYLPTDWSYEIAFDENYMEKVNITGNELNLNLVYEPVETDSSKKWNVKDNTIYENTRSVLYNDEGRAKVALNKSQTITSTNFETNIEEEQEYGLFITLTKNNISIKSLTDTELSYIKYVMDQYEENTI